MKEWHYVFTVLMICFFILGVLVFIDYRITELENKMSVYDDTCKKLIEIVQEQQKTEERILEQNIILCTEIRLKGDE
jgi:uncharacterized coiled-coil protein SlyX